MTETQREKAVLLAMKASGLEGTVVVSVSEGERLQLHEGAEADPEALRSKYDLITDDARVKYLVKKKTNDLLKVAKTAFFSPNTSVQVVEIATFEGDFVIPIAVTFSVEYQGGGLVFLTTPSRTIAVANAVAEERQELIEKQEVSRSASKKQKLKR
ncbi:hypothetical protein [Xanthomonas arboricola]|uniref:hypothetical protein n=1 Tax=Xanthomonas arboricola TaxID=56448 RepID=UPI0023BA18E8|nr:hypothetical protein [Xanthomonas arboricola]